jgi:predicted pyridoxine 5'-phosphate oxidase superfamily flavin-nucleotide-binding protein
MVKFNDDMRDIFAKAKIYIMATASLDGKPNGVPMGLVRMISDDEILIADNFMQKTRKNLEENPRVAVSFWNPKGPGGYQFKGKARIETSGKHFDEVARHVRSTEHPVPIKTKAVVIVKVDEIYYVGARHDCEINLAEQE